MIPVSFDGNAINDITNYESLIELDGYGLPLIYVVTAQRQGVWPLVSGVKRDEKRISLQVFIRGASVDTLRKQLFQYFDYEDETPKKLIVEDTEGGNDRYVMAVCRGVFPDEIMPETCYHVALVVDDDVKWRETTLTTPANWGITASGQTNALTNNGQDNCYPKLTITPNTVKTGGYAKRRFISIRWGSTNAAANYPTDIVAGTFDTATEVSGGDMQADGDDLRVWVDGVEVDRWLYDMNTANTHIWCNVDWQGLQESTLNGAHNNSQQTFYLNGDISGWPNSGLFLVDAEIISYTGKSNVSGTLTGCTRGTKSSAPASHLNGATVWWMQHDIWLVYGNSTATAPAVDNNKKPAFDLTTSTNAAWDYNDFGDINEQRSARWEWVYGGSGLAAKYTANHRTNATPYAEIGSQVFKDAWARWSLMVPTGISNANMSTIEKWGSTIGSAAAFDGRIQSSYDMSNWNDEYQFAVPGTPASWTADSRNEVINSGSIGVGLYMGDPIFTTYNAIECSDVAINIGSQPSSISIWTEQTNYDLDAIITNNTTGEAIKIQFQMKLGEDLEINTDEKTVIYLEDNSNQFQALSLLDEIRRDWLRLQPGSNTLQYDETGVASVTIAFSWEERHYQ